VHRGVLRASEGHIGGSALGIDPDWYRNFLVHPEADFTVARERKASRAPVATREEAADLWPQVVAADRPYGRYQHRSPRDVSLVLLEPR
jgi:deazaflavin-dependent oxidoreductase (nitroreductase family)